MIATDSGQQRTQLQLGFADAPPMIGAMIGVSTEGLSVDF